jgi:hypothetical protein
MWWAGRWLRRGVVFGVEVVDGGAAGCVAVDDDLALDELVVAGPAEVVLFAFALRL